MYESRYQRSRSPVRRGYDRSSSSKSYGKSDNYRSRELRDVGYSDKSDSKPAAGDSQRDSRSYSGNRDRDYTDRTEGKSQGYSAPTSSSYSESKPSRFTDTQAASLTPATETVEGTQDGGVAILSNVVESTPFASTGTAEEGAEVPVTAIVQAPEAPVGNNEYNFNNGAAPATSSYPNPTETYSYDHSSVPVSKATPDKYSRQSRPSDSKQAPSGGRYNRQREMIQPQHDQTDYGHGESSQMQEPEAETDPEYKKQIYDVSSLIKPSEKKFNGRCRLFVANLVNSVTQDDLRKLFEQFGETNEVYVNKEKGFGFIRLDYQVHAELAKNILDNHPFKGRNLKVRFATHASAIEVHGLGHFASNEYLEQAFSSFGEVETATIVCDERGKTKGYAIIEFAWKKAAQHAIQRINEGVFVLGRLPKPISAKPFQQKEDKEGVHEADLERIPGYAKEREYGPRLISPDSPEYEAAKRWKTLLETERVQIEALERDHVLAREKLEHELSSAAHDQEAELMRQDLMRKQEELRRHEEMRRQEDDRRQQMMQQAEMRFNFRGQQQQQQQQQQQEDINRHEEAQIQESFIMRQKQELESRRRNQGSDQMFRDSAIRQMQTAAASVGIRGLSPQAAAAAVAMAAGASSATARNKGQGGPDPRMMMGNSPRMPPAALMSGLSQRLPSPMPAAMQVQRQIMEARRAVAARAGGMIPGMRRESPMNRAADPFNSKRPRRM